MTYTINNRCIACDSCRPMCPVGAVKVQGEEYWIDPMLCNGCEGYYPEPQCIVSCPVNSPVPLEAKKGRCKVDAKIITSPDLFTNGKNSPFASAIVIWELCNILAQQQSLSWQLDANGELCYQRQVNRDRGAMSFWLTKNFIPAFTPGCSLTNQSLAIPIEEFDLRATCLHLLYAAYATTLERPWEEEFVISDRQIEEYIGLDKRKDLNKLTKLTLIKKLAQQPCQIDAEMTWQPWGKMPGFTIPRSSLWTMVNIQHHFQEDDLGRKHLAGLTFKIRAGQWANYFLNKQGCRERAALYQYGTLPKSLLTKITSCWRQHEGAARMMLWLLFKTKIGQEQRITVSTLMRVAYGEDKLASASADRQERKRLSRIFENDLEMLSNYGLKPMFDPVTYPPEIQPFWAKLDEIPEDAEAALEFWMNDASSGRRLTDAGPRGKWNRLVNARILSFKLPPDWEQVAERLEKKKQRNTQHRVAKIKPSAPLSSEQIVLARKKLQLSQRQLAEQLGKSQSWIRDIENGRFQAKSDDLLLLQKVLGIG